MKIAFCGSSLLAAYWNGAATYYRGMLRNLAALGHEIRFYEPDAFDRQQHRDIEPPDWAQVVVYPADEASARAVITQAEASSRSEEHTSELQSLMRISYAVFCLKKKKNTTTNSKYTQHTQDNKIQ